jgi:hypothetical protein
MMSMMRMILDDCLIAACALCFCVIFISRPSARLKYKYNTHPVYPIEQVDMRPDNVHVQHIRTIMLKTYIQAIRF